MGAQGRITKADADGVVRSAVDDAVSEDELKLKKAENVLLDAIVEYLGNPAEVAAARRLHPKWIDKVYRMTVEVNGLYVELKTQSYSGQKHTPLVPAHLCGGMKKIGRESRGIDEQILKHDERRRELGERRKMLEVKVRALVEGAGTIKKLAYRWPEGEQYWTHLLRAWESQKQLPVVNVGEVNSLLGIPREQAGAAP